MGSTEDRLPRWARDIDESLAVRSQFVLWGNIRDVFPLETSGETLLVPVRECLWRTLSRSGYECLVVYDPIDGLSVFPHDPTTLEVIHDVLNIQLKDDGGSEVTLECLQQYLRVVSNGSDRRLAFVIDYGSRIVEDPEHLSDPHREFFAFCEKMSHTATPVTSGGDRSTPLYNPIIWLLDREGDLPSWLVGGNRMIRSVAIPLPNYGERAESARSLMTSFLDHETFDEESRAALVETFAALTEGMMLSSMIEITRLARDRQIGLGELPDAVRSYKVGILESPWRREYLRDRIMSGERELSRRILGQRAAITRCLDILKRSVMGLSGAQAAGGASRPRGVLFLAGPTGVGKTELAKAITEMVFGDENAYIRFDMSEFSAEHADARFIGAPPGYVGYDAGGELTNAVRQRPFSLVLFDEIEKAHDRILDKFLQILEDGRLTDGRGSTVHFSETILVFTSNLGFSVEDQSGVPDINVTLDLPYDEVERRIRGAIEHYFKVKLNRPELLNRLGDNIVVFDFIRPDTAEAIFDLFVENIEARVRHEHKAELKLADKARRRLLAWCTEDLSNGARGIGSALETTLVNPLARELFASGVEARQQILIEDVTRDETAYHVSIK